jgi:hypothetical protein
MVQAIETNYNGYRFRSRLEARWAVFFDELGVKWEYEREGYALPSGPYLPDFWLPTSGVWVEVKGADPTDDEMLKCAQLRSETHKDVLLACGLPGEQPGTLFRWDPIVGSAVAVKRDVLDEAFAGSFLAPGTDPGLLGYGQAIDAAKAARFDVCETPNKGALKMQAALVTIHLVQMGSYKMTKSLFKQIRCKVPTLAQESGALGWFGEDQALKHRWDHKWLLWANEGSPYRCTFAEYIEAHSLNANWPVNGTKEEREAYDYRRSEDERTRNLGNLLKTIPHLYIL